MALANPVITTPSPLASVVPGTPYEEPLAATAGSPPYSWALVGGSLPPGLTLDATTGIVAGTVATSGGVRTYRAVVQVIDQNGHLAQKTFAVDVGQGVSGLVDAVFLMDTTGDMAGPLNNLQVDLTTVIIPSLLSTHPDAAFGVASFRDFPFASFGDQGSYPYRVGQALTTDTNRVQTAVNALATSGGGDDLESGTEALYLAATGQGVSWPPSDKPAGAVPAVPLGFRAGSARVVVAITNADFDDGPVYVAAGITGAHSEAQAIQALASGGIVVVGIAVGDTLQGFRSRPVLERYARATGAVVPVSTFPGVALCPTGLNGAGLPPDPDGMCPLVYEVDSAGAGLSQAFIAGINEVLGTP